MGIKRIDKTEAELIAELEAQGVTVHGKPSFGRLSVNGVDVPVDDVTIRFVDSGIPVYLGDRQRPARVYRAEPLHFVVEETPNSLDESWIRWCLEWQAFRDKQIEEVERYCSAYKSVVEQLAELNQAAPAQAVDPQEVKKHRWNPQTMSFGLGEPPPLTQQLAGAVPAAVEPPKHSAHNVKPAISGLTTTTAEDHRLGRFKA